MAQLTVVLEGSLKYRDGKKWKPRWCIIRKLSPAADRLHISLYKSARDRFRNGLEKANIPLENFYGIDSSLQLDKERHVMAIVCLHDTILLAFQNEQTLQAWEIAVRRHLGEEHQFPLLLIKAPASAKLPRGQVSLFIQGNKFCLTNQQPPRILATWLLCDIRKFGIIEGKFCFQAGSQCEKLSGVFAFASDQAETITSALQEASDKANQSRSRRNSSSSSRQYSKTSLCSSQSTLNELQTGSLPREIHKKNFGDSQVYADQNFITEGGTGLVRCATASQADYKRPVVPPHNIREVTQSTPNIKQSKSKENIIGRKPTAVEPQTSSKPQKPVIEPHKKKADSPDNCKSRRYSSADVHLARVKQALQNIVKKQTLFGASAAALSRKSVNPQRLQNQRSQSEVDISDFYSRLQRGLDVLSPKLSKPEDLKAGLAGGNRARNQNLKTGSSSCLLGLASHGHGNGYTSNSSLEILQSYHLNEKLVARAAKAKSSSSGSSACSTRDLVETPTVTCSIGSLLDLHTSLAGSAWQLSPRSSILSQENNPTNRSLSVANIYSQIDGLAPVAHSASLSQLDTSNQQPLRHSLSKPPTSVTMRQDRGVKTLPANASNMRTVNPGSSYCGTATPGSRPYRTRPGSAPCPNNRLSNGGTSPDPHQPLQYVDLSRYDGLDDGYIYVLKKDTTVVSRQTRAPKIQNANKNRHPEYQNIPSSPLRVSETKSDRVKSKDSGNVPARNFVTIHGSLRRSDNKGVVQNFHDIDQMDFIQARLNAGEYVRLKETSNQEVVTRPPRPIRKSRGGSLENILEKGDDQTGSGFARMVCDKNSSTYKHPGSDLSAVVPARLAAYSKEDLMKALAEQAEADNRLTLHSKVPPYSPTDNKDLDYMVMASPNAKVDKYDDVFSTVELPPNYEHSDYYNCSASRSIPCPTNNGISLNSSVPVFSSTPNENEEEGYLDMSHTQPMHHASTEPAYLDMSLGRKSSIDIPRRGSSSRPKLQHSKSLDDELDGPYLDMNLGLRQPSADYLCMSPEKSTGQNQRGSAIYANTAPLKPFDNLIEHKCFTKKCKNGDDSSVSSSSLSKTKETNSSGGDKSSSDDDNTSVKSNKSAKKSSASSKSGSKGLFSRLIKRSSLKKEKNKLKHTQSTQEFSNTHHASLDRRLSMQTTTSHSNISTKFSVGPSADSEPSVSMTGSTDSGLVALSQWRLGSRTITPDRTVNSHDLSRSTSLRVTNQDNSNSYGVDMGVLPLPPKSYNKRQSAGPGLSDSSNVENEAYLQINLPRKGTSHSTNSSGITNGTNNYCNMKTIAEVHGGEAPRGDGDNISLSSIPDTDPPPLPEKTKSVSNRSLVSLGSSVQNKSGTGVSENEDDDVFLDESLEQTNRFHKNSFSGRHGTVVPPGESDRRPRKNPNLTVAIPRTSESRSSPHQQQTGGEDRHGPRAPRTSSTRSASSSSCDSCDTHSTYCEDHHHHHHHHVSSPAISTMRPRFGKEYKRIDRKKIAEELNMSLPGQSSVTHSTEPSPSMASTVFNFDPAVIKSRHSSTCSGFSIGDNSPKYQPSMGGSSRHSRDPAYVNLSFSRTSSPVILESTPPPQSPGGRSVMSDSSQVMLNYAEIDLTDAGKGKKSTRSIPKKGGVEYAVIDMIATAAVSRVSREHAQNREDSLLRRGYDANHGSSYMDKKTGSITLPTPSREKRTALGRSNSTSSRGGKP